MTTLKLSEAKAHLGTYAREAAEGKRFVITQHNRPVAVLSGMDELDTGIQPVFGLMDGKSKIPDDFDAPLEDFQHDFYGE